jgi:hypothetical protein
MISKRDAQRLRRLLRRRIAQFERRLKEMDENALVPAGELEREARALLALMKALDNAAELERRAAAADDEAKDPDSLDADFRARLARRLEALCAKTRPPRRGGGA